MNGNTTTKGPWYRNRRMHRLSCAAFGVVLFVYGVGVGHYQWQPFGLIHKTNTVLTQMRHWPVKEVKEYRGEQELLQNAFTDPVTEENLYYPPINTLEEIQKSNLRLLMQRSGFETAYEDIDVIGAEQVSGPEGNQLVVRLRFTYQSREYNAFAYGTLPDNAFNMHTASAIIPGSGLNQSLRIATGHPRNYHHGILAAEL